MSHGENRRFLKRLVKRASARIAGGEAPTDNSRRLRRLVLVVLARSRKMLTQP